MSKPSGAQVRAAQLLVSSRGGTEIDALPLRLANLTPEQRAEALTLITELLPRIVHRAPAGPRGQKATDVEQR